MPKDRTAPDRRKGAAKSTVRGPKKGPRGPGNGPAERKMQGAQALAAAASTIQSGPPQPSTTGVSGR